jgi:hypothetical protein
MLSENKKYFLAEAAQQTLIFPGRAAYRSGHPWLERCTSQRFQAARTVSEHSA